MGTSGLEPPTSRLSGVRTNHLSYAPITFLRKVTAKFDLANAKPSNLPFGFFGHSIFLVLGGDEEDRTPDPLRARQVLSQLSYTPIVQGPYALVKLLFQATSKLNNNSALKLLLTGVF